MCVVVSQNLARTHARMHAGGWFGLLLVPMPRSLERGGEAGSAERDRGGVPHVSVCSLTPPLVVAPTVTLHIDVNPVWSLSLKSLVLSSQAETRLVPPQYMLLILLR